MQNAARVINVLAQGKTLSTRKVAEIQPKGQGTSPDKGILNTRNFEGIEADHYKHTEIDAKIYSTISEEPIKKVV